MKYNIQVLMVAVALILGAVVCMVFFIFSDAVSKDRFAVVTKGMTEAQVRELLGVPDGVRHDTPDRTAFFCGGFLRAKWCTMEVFFGADGRVTGKFHDH